MLQRTLRNAVLCSAITLMTLGWVSAQAQDKGLWRAQSSDARAITGDIALSESRLTINFLSFTLAPIRAVTAAEITALFNPDTDPDHPGALYRVSIPASRQFLHRNTLCGSDDTQWMLTYTSGRTLKLAFFSGQAIPTLTPKAIADGSALCGSYTYIR